MEGDHTELDKVLRAVGPISRFPILQCFIYYLSYVWDAFQLYGIVFIGQDVQYKCAPPTNGSDIIIPELHGDWPNVTVHYGKCGITVVRNNSGDISSAEYSCVYGMEYDQPKDMSIASEYDLVCGREALTGLTQTLLALGGGLGSVILPYVSDRFGRLRCIVISLLLSVPCGIAAGIAPDYGLHTAMKFTVGLLMPGIGVTAFTAAVELFPSSHRPFANTLGSGVWWCFCLSMVAPYTYFLRFQSWRTVQMASCAWGILIIPIVVFLSEPFRWLVANNKIDTALKVLKKAARWNGMDHQSIIDVFRAVQASWGESEEKGNGDTTLSAAVQNSKVAEMKVVREKMSNLCCNVLSRRQVATIEPSFHEEQLGYKDLFINRRMRRNSFICFFIWFAHSWINSALMLMSASLAGSVYLNFFLNSLVEGFACVVAFLLLTRVQRRKTIGGFLVVAGLGLISSSLCLQFKGDRSYLRTVATVFSLIGKFGIGASYNTLFMYTPEMFPTQIRNRALGLTLVAATVGGMLAPYSNLLADVAIWLPGAIFGACAFLAAPMMALLPETKGRELPQTIDDLEAWYNVPCSTKTTETYTMRT